jgi:hypothetical protein
MPELRAHLATFATLNVHSNSMSVAQFEQDDAYGQAILRQGSLSLSKSEGSDWAEAYPILTAAARIQADMRFLKQAGPEATTAIQQETATLWKRLITSQEILDEIARQQEETAQTQDHA